MSEKEERPIWELGMVLDGDYRLGCYGRKYYVVVGHTKGGAPRVRRLELQEVSYTSDHAESSRVIQLKLPIECTGPVLTARWWPAAEKYGFCDRSIGFNDEGVKVTLHKIHVDGSTYTESSYY